LPPGISTTKPDTFFRKPTKYGVPDPIPFIGEGAHTRQRIDHKYLDGNMAIARFNAADRPAAQHDIAEMIRDVLSRVMDYISQRHWPAFRPNAGV
jgi:hypothetical protein